MKLDPNSTVVLACDLQFGILGMNPAATAVLPFAAKVAEAVRRVKLPLFHVGVQFSKGYPEINTRNKRMAGIRERGVMLEGSKDVQWHPDVYREGEPTITKNRISAFGGSKLAEILRAHETKTIVLFGVSTSGVILSTTRYAADLDYQIIIIKDACGDGDPEVHKVLTEKVFPSQATVVTTDEFLTQWL